MTSNMKGYLMQAGVPSMLAMFAIGYTDSFAAGDAGAGKSKASLCAACHGATGVSTNQEWPSLAGQGYTYLVQQLKAFRAGTRKDPIMAPIAKSLSDQDVENLAAFFSTQTTGNK
jgi:cytochrome c553